MRVQVSGGSGPTASMYVPNAFIHHSQRRNYNVSFWARAYSSYTFCAVSVMAQQCPLINGSEECGGAPLFINNLELMAKNEDDLLQRV